MIRAAEIILDSFALELDVFSARFSPAGYSTRIDRTFDAQKLPLRFILFIRR